MKQNPLIIAIGALLILIVALLLFVFQVRKSEVVVVTRFGRPARDVGEPGPHFRLPWPIENVHRFDQRVQNFEDKLTEGYTADNFTLLTSVYVGWRITDPKLFFPKFTGGAEPITEAERTLDRMLSNAKAAVISKHPLMDLLTPASEGNKFVEIEKEILGVLQRQVDANAYGLEIRFLGIKKLALPEKVTAAVFDRMQSERKVLSDTSESEGERDAANIRSEANRKAAELLADADSQAVGIRAEGEAKAAESLKVFQKNADLANWLFRLSAVENSLKEHSTIIIDQNVPPFDVLKGPPANLLNNSAPANR
jgi:membrane protease subunit HflC